MAAGAEVRRNYGKSAPVMLGDPLQITEARRMSLLLLLILAGFIALSVFIGYKLYQKAPDGDDQTE